MEFLYLIFTACLRLRSQDVDTNPGQTRPVPDVCRIVCSNVRGLAGNLNDLNVSSSQYDILLCSEALVSDVLHVSELQVSGFSRPVVLCRDKMRWLHTYEMVTEYFVNRNLCVVVVKLCFYGLWCETEPLCIQSLPQP